MNKYNIENPSVDINNNDTICLGYIINSDNDEVYEVCIDSIKKYDTILRYDNGQIKTCTIKTSNIINGVYLTTNTILCEFNENGFIEKISKKRLD